MTRVQALRLAQENLRRKAKAKQMRDLAAWENSPMGKMWKDIPVGTPLRIKLPDSYEMF